MANRVFTPQQFVGSLNQMLFSVCRDVLIGGEVANLTVGQGRWVFFDLKDATTSVPCFMWLTNMRVPLEDGMKVVVKCQPQVRPNGRFSLTVLGYQLVGEGSIKKAYEMLKEKLAREGIFAASRKRVIKRGLRHIGVITSTGAAGYADFVKIVNARWGGMKFSVAHCQVQGMEAPSQMVRALQYFNERAEVEAIVMIRGGGSADDLACYNDERLVRAVAASKIPVMTGIGHEVDEVLCDLAADVRASTPSNAAELITFDRHLAINKVREKVGVARQAFWAEVGRAEAENMDKVERVGQSLLSKYIEPMLFANTEKVRRMNNRMRMEIDPLRERVAERVRRIYEKMWQELQRFEEKVATQLKVLSAVNPDTVLSQGYAILAGKISPGSVVKITTLELEAEAEIKQVTKRS